MRPLKMLPGGGCSIHFIKLFLKLEMMFLGLVEETKGSTGQWKLIDDYMKINQKITIFELNG